MKKLLLALTILALSAVAAHAEVFVWQDPAYKMQVAYPDNWMRQAQLQPDLRLFIVGPQGADHASCRLYVSHDGRFMEAPASQGTQISAFVFDQNEMVKEFYTRPDTNNVRVSNYGTTSSLGSAAAIMALVDFSKSWMGTMIPMHAMAVASQYDGNRIFMSCEASATNFANWEQLFRGIFKSVSFPGAYATEPNGLYRRFQDDGGVILPMNLRNDAVSIY